MISELTEITETAEAVPFCGWIFYDRDCGFCCELAHRFDVACCTTQDQFRREARAVTRAGQIKGRDERHEKDDRHRVDDRSRYVLGWSNESKIAALEAKARTMEPALQRFGGEIAEAQAKLREAKSRIETLNTLDAFQDFQDIDWQK